MSERKDTTEFLEKFGHQLGIKTDKELAEMYGALDKRYVGRLRREMNIEKAKQGKIWTIMEADPELFTLDLKTLASRHNVSLDTISRARRIAREKIRLAQIDEENQLVFQFNTIAESLQTQRDVVEDVSLTKVRWRDVVKSWFLKLKNWVFNR